MHRTHCTVVQTIAEPAPVDELMAYRQNEIDYAKEGLNGVHCCKIEKSSHLLHYRLENRYAQPLEPSSDRHPLQEVEVQVTQWGMNRKTKDHRTRSPRNIILEFLLGISPPIFTGIVFKVGRHDLSHNVAHAPQYGSSNCFRSNWSRVEMALIPLNEALSSVLSGSALRARRSTIYFFWDR